MKKKTETTTIMKRKLGKCQKTGQEHARIWLENKKLSEIGFTPGSHFTREWIPTPTILTGKGVSPTLKLWLLGKDDIVLETHSVSEKKGTSVIDLTGWTIKQFFDGYTHYTVEYAKGIITIRGANG